MALLAVEGLRTSFFTKAGVVRAVDDVSFTLDAGDTLGVVGESGCGKSVTALSIMRLIDLPGRIVAGRASLNGVDLLGLDEAEMLYVRGKQIAMIFQEPMTSLNPTVTVGEQIMEALDTPYYDAWRRSIVTGATRVIRRLLGLDRARARELRRRAIDLLASVNIPAPELRLDDYPYMLSGGMLQRIMIAIALASDPVVLIADEPTTALDVTIQAQILDILADRRRAANVATILITHDLGIVAEMCDRVAVMYAGRLVEVGSVDAIFSRPQHPYTQALLRSIPPLERKLGLLPAIEGSVPDLQELNPSSCYFADRCPYVMDVCHRRQPPLTAGQDKHQVACHLYSEPSAGPQQAAASPGGGVGNG